MDFAPMLNTLKELVSSEGTRTRNDIMLHVTEQMGKMQGQLDQTNYRITDLGQQLSDRIAETNQRLGDRISDLNLHVIDLGRRMDEGFAAERHQRERDIEREIGALAQRMDLRFDLVDARFDAVDQRMDGFDQRMGGFDKRMDGFEKRLDRVEGCMDRMEKRMNIMDGRLERIAQTVAPKADHESLTRRVDKLERDVEEIKHRSPDEAA